MPRHVAIIMDGNGRWAKSRGFTRIYGHRNGSTAVRNTVTACRELGIPYLTLFAFSEENWKRPKHEILLLMRLLKKFLIAERSLLVDRNIRLETIGDIQKLPKDVLKVLNDTCELTRHHDAMVLTLALSYGGRSEIVRAVKTIALKISEGALRPEDIDDALLSSHLDTRRIPDPDLIIRTSGEMRTSNFLPWQGIYSEWYITPVMWPDFTVDELHHALEDYSSRERRFGMTGEQVKHSLRGQRT